MSEDDLDASILPALEIQCGVSLKDASLEALQFISSQSRTAGNKCFKERDFKEAVKLYSQAIAADKTDFRLYSNRSAAYLALGRFEESLQDAMRSVRLEPKWSKAHFRLGCAFAALKDWERAAQSFQTGAKLDPSNKELAGRAAAAKAEADYEAEREKVQMAIERKGLIYKLRQARRDEARAAMEFQFRQAAVAPDWELDDYDWRPTFFPQYKLEPLTKGLVFEDPKAHSLANYVNALADLAGPKNALPLLRDEAALSAFDSSIRDAVNAHPGSHVLVLGRGTGVLGLLAARNNARKVTCIERGRMLYRMAKHVIDANRGEAWSDSLRLLPSRLYGCGVAGEALAPDTVKALQAARAGFRRFVIPAPSPTTVLGNGDGSTVTTAQPTPQETTPEDSLESLGTSKVDPHGDQPQQPDSISVTSLLAPSTPDQDDVARRDRPGRPSTAGAQETCSDGDGHRTPGAAAPTQVSSVQTSAESASVQGTLEPSGKQASVDCTGTAAPVSSTGRRQTTAESESAQGAPEPSRKECSSDNADSRPAAGKVPRESADPAETQLTGESAAGSGSREAPGRQLSPDATTGNQAYDDFVCVEPSGRSPHSLEYALLGTSQDRAGVTWSHVIEERAPAELLGPKESRGPGKESSGEQCVRNHALDEQVESSPALPGGGGGGGNVEVSGQHLRVYLEGGHVENKGESPRGGGTVEAAEQCVRKNVEDGDMEDGHEKNTHRGAILGGGGNLEDSEPSVRNDADDGHVEDTQGAIPGGRGGSVEVAEQRVQINSEDGHMEKTAGAVHSGGGGVEVAEPREQNNAEESHAENCRSGAILGGGGGVESAGRWSENEQSVIDAQCNLSSRADILVTDLLDHGLLGLDLLKSVDYAAMRLLHPGALVVPALVQVFLPSARDLCHPLQLHLLHDS
eukprot:jgi/Botrbrau1/10864/Bobra.0025s0041.1